MLFCWKQAIRLKKVFWDPHELSLGVGGCLTTIDVLLEGPPCFYKVERPMDIVVDGLYHEPRDVL